MNEGDYVRTKDGTLWKPETFYDEGDVYIFDEFFEYSKDEIKSSPRIIKLVQQGDYVNGYKVFNIETSYILDKNNNRIGEKISLDIGNDMYGSTIYIEEKDIKTIVTKEQFESMEYKVGK